MIVSLWKQSEAAGKFILQREEEGGILHPCSFFDNLMNHSLSLQSGHCCCNVTSCVMGTGERVCGNLLVCFQHSDYDDVCCGVSVPQDRKTFKRIICGSASRKV